MIYNKKHKSKNKDRRIAKHTPPENNNRMIRRWIPKEVLIDNISKDFIKKIEEWLNNYPRAMFDYKSSNMLLLEI